MKDLTISEVIITVSMFIIAVSALVIANTQHSRDFNDDGKVDLVDLSILAAEINAANEQK